MDAGSVGVVVARNLVYDVAGSALVWNGVMAPVDAWPTANNSGATVVENNVFVADRDNAYSRAFVAQGQASRNPAVQWNGVTAARFERNVVVTDNMAAGGRVSAPSRQAWFNGKPCASQSGAPAAAANCTWDLADSFLRARAAPGVANANFNVYFNASSAAGS